MEVSLRCSHTPKDAVPILTPAHSTFSAGMLKACVGFGVEIGFTRSGFRLQGPGLGFNQRAFKALILRRGCRQRVRLAQEI